MNDPAFLRVPTLLGEMSQKGTAVACVTAKGKLLRLLTKGLNPSTSFGFSVEAAEQQETTDLLRDVAGISGGIRSLMKGWASVPTVYEPDCSIFGIDAGLQLLQGSWGNQAPILYLSTTDYVQHKYPPGSAEANDFYSKVDSLLAKLDAIGAVVGLTADHGMGQKSDKGGPIVLFLESELRDRGLDVRVILPITDPYVVHHASLGGYAVVYMKDESRAQDARAILQLLPGVEEVMSRAQAAEQLELPADRLGDLVVLADNKTALGRSQEYHNLGEVPSLRSHGSRSEEWVPLWVNRHLAECHLEPLTKGRLRNFDLFDVLLNQVD